MSRLSAAAVLLALAGASCGNFSEDEDLVVISVGERDVTQAVLDRFTGSRTGLGGTLDAPLLSALLDEFVREQLLVIAAEEERIAISEVQLIEETSALRRAPGPEAVRTDDETAAPESAGSGTEAPDEDWLRSRVRDRLMVDRLMDTVVLADLEATDEALQLEFEANRAFYARPETVTLSERRFDDRESAEAAAGLLRQESRFRRGGRWRRPLPAGRHLPARRIAGRGGRGGLRPRFRGHHRRGRDRGGVPGLPGGPEASLPHRSSSKRCRTWSGSRFFAGRPTSGFRRFSRTSRTATPSASTPPTSRSPTSGCCPRWSDSRRPEVRRAAVMAPPAGNAGFSRHAERSEAKGRSSRDLGGAPARDTERRAIPGTPH